MRVIISRRNDIEPIYEDDVFSVYHYPAKYRKQLHLGDSFICCQGNQRDKDKRCYFGTGCIGNIRYAGDEYCANLICYRQFSNMVPIGLSDGGYVEQLGFEEVRQSPNPPWQLAIRPISQPAYDYILNHAGILTEPKVEQSIEQLSANMKKATRGYFLNHTNLSLLDIERNAHRLAEQLCSYVADPCETNADDQPQNLISYCESMRITYSYKPLLILALLDWGAPDGAIAIDQAAAYLLAYYDSRRCSGRLVEIKPCIWLDKNVSTEDSIANLQANPVRALLGSGFFEFDKKTKVFKLKETLWGKMSASDVAKIRRACTEKLKRYYGES